LLGAFVQGAAYTYGCDVHGNCPATYTGTDVPLLHLPLGRADRPQLRLGVRRVQRRGQGPAAGHPGRHPDRGHRGRPRSPLPARRRQPDHPARQARAQRRHELIDGIGVAPDYYLPLTAHDLSTGHDPDIAKALALLGGR